MPIASGTGPEVTNCESLKMNTQPSIGNDPSFVPYNCAQSPEPEGMTEVVYTPSPDSYGCPPGGFVLVPVPYMMDQSGQLVQFPCPMDQSGQMVWAVPSNAGLPSSACHMMQRCSDGSASWASAPSNAREESNPSAPPAAADMDGMHNAPKVGTWFKKMPSVAEETSEETSGGDVTHNDNMSASESTALPDDIAALGKPRQLLYNAELASSVEDLLEFANPTKRAAIITWMQPAVVELALSANGTRVVQKAFEVGRSESQIKLIQCLHGRVRQLLDSHHGNHVLQNIIVKMPPHALHFIFYELSSFHGGWAGVIKHRFGCRVVERLLEHCEPELLAPIVSEVVADIDSIARHPFANYVVQHILEHVPDHRQQVVNALIHAGVPALAQHRVASNVVERAFVTGRTEMQRSLSKAILQTPNAIVQMGCTRYGTFTVRQMLEIFQQLVQQDQQLAYAGNPANVCPTNLELYSWMLQQLAPATQTLRMSKHGRHIAARVSAALAESSNRYPTW